VGRLNLRVEQREASRAEPLDEVGDGGLRGVGAAVEHRLAAEEPAEGHAVKATHERLALPHLDAVREAARCSSAYARRKSSVIQVAGRSSVDSPQARMTPAKSRSIVKRQPARRALRPTVRWGRHVSSSKIARGSGDHHVTAGSDDQGKMPAR